MKQTSVDEIREIKARLTRLNLPTGGHTVIVSSEALTALMDVYEKVEWLRAEVMARFAIEHGRRSGS